MSITLILIVLTVIVSLQGFTNNTFRYKAMLIPVRCFHDKEYYRLFTAGFLHADWVHLFVNMWVLYLFGRHLEDASRVLFGSWGPLLYLSMYLLAIPAASLSTLFKHKDHSNYASLGASGAVSAVLFAYILLYPTSSLYLLLIPIPVNAVIMGVLYLGYSYYMAQRGGDHINHEAHFYGALFGIAFYLVLKPQLFGYFIDQIQSLL